MLGIIIQSYANIFLESINIVNGILKGKMIIDLFNVNEIFSFKLILKTSYYKFIHISYVFFNV